MTKVSITYLLLNELKQTAKKKEFDYIQLVSSWLQEIFSSHTKKELVGFLNDEKDTGKQFNPNEYTTVGSFVCNEYNPNGSHEFYESDLMDLTEIWLNHILLEVIKRLIQEKKHLLFLILLKEIY